VKCLYYPAPTLDSARHISDDLHAVGVRDFFLHVISKDEAGLELRHIPSSNYLETLDLARDGLIGTAIGFVAGLIGVGLLKLFEPFGSHVPSLVYFATVAAATLFGAWEGGLTGIATENKKLAMFHNDIEAGRCLILIYVLNDQEATVTQLMRAFHQSIQCRETRSGVSSPGWRAPAEGIAYGAGSCIGAVGRWNDPVPLPQPLVVYSDRIQLEDDG
jgi:hypothetical protein